MCYFDQIIVHFIIVSDRFRVIGNDNHTSSFSTIGTVFNWWRFNIRCTTILAFAKASTIVTKSNVSFSHTGYSIDVFFLFNKTFHSLTHVSLYSIFLGQFIINWRVTTGTRKTNSTDTTTRTRRSI